MMIKTRKFFMTVIVLALIGLSAKGQVPTWEWAKDAVSSSSSGYGDFYAMTSDLNGNVFVTGIFHDTISFGSFTLYSLNPNGLNNIYIVKYNSSGIVLWAKSANDSAGLFSYSMAPDNLGNVYVTGYFATSSIAFGSYTLTNPSNEVNAFIVKYDPNGNVLWAKSSIGTTNGEDYGNSITTDVNRNVYVTGYFTSQKLSFGTDTINNTGQSNIFIVKYDANGNLMWLKGAGGNWFDGTYGIACDSFRGVGSEDSRV